ncbi:hypothetical protein DL96DRAFT_1821095 [Flagelloscypha sp. PMI_526]|nr:hypothetical protein DL96DRAFT_1821095 [Flagelloscypha sp. PMI_526]
MGCLTTSLTLLLFGFSVRAQETASHEGSSKGIQWIDCNQNVPAPVQSALNITNWDNSTLGPLPPTLTCGRLDVPLDYGKPLSKSNKITLAFSLYTPVKPVGTIFFNPGGPGDEAQSYAWELATNQTQAFAGLEDHQFMMMDTRGTWASSPFNCSLAAFSEIPYGTPEDEATFDKYRKTSRAYGNSCLANSDEIKHVGTKFNVRDWESVRIALKKPKISLLGVSYGTYYFAEYVQTFTKSIERAALDAVTARGKSDVELIKDEVRAVNRMLLRADAYCQSNSSCPLHSQGKGSVVTAWRQVLAQAKNGTLVACADGETTCTQKVSVGDARLSVSFMLRGTPFYDLLMQTLAGVVLQNNAAGLVTPDEVKAAVGVEIPLFCVDNNIDDNSLKGWKAIEKATVPLDPNSMQASLNWQGKLDCTDWPVPSRAKVDLSSVANFPFLWITSDFDLNTPTEWATFNHNQTPKSTLVVRHGDSHGTIYVPGPARDAIVQYLRTGKVSPSSDEKLATIYPPGKTRNDKTQIPDPYSIGFGPEQGDANHM